MGKKLILIFIIGVVAGGASLYFYQSQAGLSPQEAGEKAINFINQALQDEGVTASLIDVGEEAGLYKIHLKIVDTEYDSFITKDGQILFSSGYNLEDQPVAAPERENPTTLDDFAQCLTDKGLKFYGSQNCSWCQQQKELFGESIQYVTYVECVDPQTNQWAQECQEAEITSTPTWELADGESVSGYQTLEQLSELSGCPLQ